LAVFRVAGTHADSVGLAPAALSFCCLASGAALVLTIVLRRPLWSTLLATSLVGCFGAASIWLRSAPAVRAVLGRRLAFGLLAGLAAVAAYDAVRWALVLGLRLRVSPFGALPYFGASLLGTAASVSSIWFAGVLYHLANGMLFGAAYTIFLGRQRWWAGVLWSLGLETAMLTFYPMWLDLRAVMGEFTVMSVSGHVAYGLVLGVMCQSRFRAS
jgi:hypothetical protein